VKIHKSCHPHPARYRLCRYQPKQKALGLGDRKHGKKINKKQPDPLKYSECVFHKMSDVRFSGLASVAFPI
jgi:hypothetical protein